MFPVLKSPETRPETRADGRLLQGRPGDKGQKGEHGGPGFDVFSALKVSPGRLRRHPPTRTNRPPLTGRQALRGRLRSGRLHHRRDRGREGTAPPLSVGALLELAVHSVFVLCCRRVCCRLL